MFIWFFFCVDISLFSINSTPQASHKSHLQEKTTRLRYKSVISKWFLNKKNYLGRWNDVVACVRTFQLLNWSECHFNDGVHTFPHKKNKSTWLISENNPENWLIFQTNV